VLAVGRLTHTAETVTLHNALEALSFGLANDADVLTFSEHVVHFHGVTRLKFLFKCVEFHEPALWSHTGTLEMALHGLRSVLLGTLAVTKLNGFVAVPLEGTYLRHDARTNFQHCAWEILPSGTVDAGHAYFFPYESGHGVCFL
jgi:hypothetical protein